MSMFKCANSRIIYLPGLVMRPLGTAKAKHSGHGLVQTSALEGRVRNEATAKSLAQLANFGLSSRTWDTYKSTINNIIRCQEETGVDMSLPFEPNQTLEFVGWMKARGLKSRTMSSYLSGVRMYHISMGFHEPGLREPIVKLILKGQSNWERVQKLINGKVGKLAVTIELMKLIKLRLGKVSWPMEEVRLLWAVMTLGWSGSFRIHEILSRTKNTFDQQTTLQWSDVKFGRVKVESNMLESISVHIKSPKIDKVGAGDNIEVVELGSSSFMCPIAAMKKYRDVSKVKEEPGMPVFRLSSGACFTGAELNKRLKVLVGDLEVHIPGGRVSSHSFRAGNISNHNDQLIILLNFLGVATEMARAGHMESELMAVGRWSSSAYKNYMTLPLSHRANIARKIALRS